MTRENELHSLLHVIITMNGDDDEKKENEGGDDDDDDDDDDIRDCRFKKSYPLTRTSCQISNPFPWNPGNHLPQMRHRYQHLNLS